MKPPIILKNNKRRFLFLLIVIASLFNFRQSLAQTTLYTSGALQVQVVRKNPCEGNEDGFITFNVLSKQPGATVRLQVISGPADPENNYDLLTPEVIVIAAATTGSYTFYGSDDVGTPLLTPSLVAGTYDFFIRETGVATPNVINSFAGDPPVVLTELNPITLTATGSTDLTNSDCQTLEGELEVAIGGGSTALTGGGSFTYTWTSNNGLTMPPSATVTGAAPIVLNLNTLLTTSGLPGGTYTLLVEDNYSSCSNTIVQEITDPSPQTFPLNTLLTPVVCEGQSGIVTMEDSENPSPLPGVSYQLFEGTTAIGAAQAGTGNAINFPVPAGILTSSGSPHNFTVVASNGFCTQRTMTGASITVNPTPVAPTVSFTPSSYCVGQTITAPSITSAVGTSTYTWYSDAALTTVLTTGATPTNTQLGFSSLTANTTTVYVRETNSSNCTGPATTVTLTVNALPVAPAVTFSPSTYCVGQTITAPQITTPTAGSTYRWYSDAALTTFLVASNAPTNGQLNFSSAAANTTSVYVIERTSAGCDGPATQVTLTVNPTPVAPTVSFTPSSYCVGQTITAPSITSAVGTSTYTWYSDAALTTVLTTGATPTTTQLGFSSASANITTVYVRETNSSNCTGPVTTVTLTVNALPVAPAVTFSPSTYCVGQTITAPQITTPTAGSTYRWYSDAALTTFLVASNAPTNGQLNFSSAAANTTSVYVIERTSAGCDGPATQVTLTVNPTPVAPTVSFTPSSYCVGQTITAPSITSAVGTSTYTWYSDAALTTVLTTGATPTTTQLGFSSASANITTVYVRETNSSNCTGPATTVTLTVNALPVAPAVTFSPSTYCVGQTITAPQITTPTAGSTYRWYSDAALTTFLVASNAPTNGQLNFSSAAANTTSVYVIERTSAGCDGPATQVTLTVNPTPVAPTVSFTPSSYCVGQTITAPSITSAVGTSTYTWYSDAALTTVLTTGATPTTTQLGFSSAAANITTVYVRETNSSNCTGPVTTVTLTVNALPVAPAVTFSPSTYCVGQTITAPQITTPTAGSTYRWYSDAALTTFLVASNAPTNGQLNFSSAAANTTSVYVIERTSAGCDGPATQVTLTVNPTPVAPTVSFTPSSYCVGQTITAPSITSAVGTSTYTWYSDAALTTVLTTGATPTNTQLGFSSLTANTTTVYVRETNSSNCTGPATTVTLTVNALPVAPAVTFSPSTYCVGQTITAPQITTPTAGSTYRWYSDAALTTFLVASNAPTNGQLNFSSAAANTTSVYVIERTSAGCDGPATQVTLTVNPTPVAPTVSFTPSSYCVGQTITAPSITSAVGTSTYTWYSDAALTTVLTTGATPTTTQLGFSSASANITTVYVRETNSSNCTGPVTTVTLTVNALPVAPAVTFSPSAYCVGETITSSPVVTTPVGASTYRWYSDAGLATLLFTGSNPTLGDVGFSSASANVTTVYVAETNASGCRGPATPVTLTVNALPAAPGVTFSPSTYCVGETLSTASVTTPVGTSTYRWYSDASLSTLIFTGTNPSNAALNFSTAASNTTTVYVVETNASGCESPSTPVTLIVNTTPTAPGVTFTSTYCVGETITAPTITTPAAGVTYRWYSDAALTTLLFTGTAPTNGVLNFSSAAANITSVFVTERTASGCEGAATTVTLTVNAVPTAPAVTFSPSAYCVGETITSSPVVTTPVGASTYRWYSDAGLATLLFTGSNPTLGDVGFSSASANVTTVYVAETNASGCQGPATPVTLTVNALPAAPEVTFSPSTYCVGETLSTASVTTPVGTSTYRWYSDASLSTLIFTGTNPSNAALNFSTAASNTTTVYVVETNASGCESPSTPVTLIVNTTPTAPGVTFTSTYCVGETITAPTITTPAAGVTYRWYSDAALTTLLFTGTAPTNGVLNFSSAAANITSVFVTERTASGCEGAATTVTLTVNAVPTAPVVTFSPNTYCVGETMTSSPAVTTPVGTSTYRWYSDAGLSTQIFTGSAPTNTDLGFTTGSSAVTSVYLVETNAAGCESPFTTVTLTVNVVPAAPVVSFTTPSICVGETIASPSISTPTGSSTYTWYSDAGLTTVLFTGTNPANVDLGFNNATANTTTVYVTESTSGGCEGPSTTVTLTVNPTPVAPAVTFTSSYCLNDAITAPSLDSPVGTSTYKWYSDAGLTTVIFTGQAPTNTDLGFSSTTVNTVTVYVTETTSSGCEGPSTSVTLTVNGLPTASISGGSTGSCAGSGVPLTFTVPATGTYDIVYTDGTSNFVLTGRTSSSTAVTVTPTVNTTYTIVSVTNASTGCSVTAPHANISGSAVVNVLALPDASFTGLAATYCVTDATATLTPATPGGSFVGPGMSGNIFNPASAGAGTHTVSYIVFSGGCLNASNVPVTVNALPVLALNQTKQICSGDNVSYSIQLSPANTPAGTILNWADPDGAGPATAGVNIPIGAAGTIHINDILTNTGTSATTVTYSITPSIASCGTGLPQDVTITLNPVPVIAPGLSKTICSAENIGDITLAGSTLSSASTISWPDPDGSGPATAGVNVPLAAGNVLSINNTLSNTSGAQSQVTYTLTPSTGTCVGLSQTIDVLVDPGASANAGADKFTCPEGSVKLTGASVAGVNAGTWTIVSMPAGGDGALSISTATTTPGNVDFTATVSGNYTLRLTSDDPSGSCGAAQDEMIVTILAANDPLCTGGGGPGGGGGNVNCTVFTVNVVEQRPSCANQDDGFITLTVTGGAPAPNYVLTLYDSIATPKFKKAVVVTPGVAYKFDDLSPSINYFYQIDDGTNVCRLPYSLPLQTTVQASIDLASVTNPTCFGSATGSAVINATGSQTGQYFYSLDNLSWKPFVPGTPGQITDLPPLGTYNILVGETAGDVCSTSVQVTINSVNPDMNTTFSITPATCDGADGAITNITTTGGSGSGYQYSIDGINFKTDNNFVALVGGFYSLHVRDGAGCEKILSANVTFPGFINFVSSVVDPTCANNGNSGSIIVKVLDPGTFKIAVSEDQFNEPDDSEYKNYSDPFISFENLSRGTYFIYAKSNTAVCPTRSSPIGMQGAYALSFEVEPTCVANDLSLTLHNISGEPNAPFQIKVYKKVTGVLVETIDRTSISATSTEFLPYLNHAFLRNADDYQIQLVQTNLATGCEITSPLVDVNIPNEVFALVGPSKKSYPDIANGAIEITNISGGGTPYEVRIELDSAASFNFPSFEKDFESVELNSNNQFTKKYENIPPGRYSIQVRDNVGCVLELTGRVKMDQTVYIPNIFTPNGDNVNDLFFIRNLPSDNAGLVITNRWGKQVIATKNYQNNWDGTGAADGIYFYQLTIDSETITGWVEILRGQKP